MASVATTSSGLSDVSDGDPLAAADEEVAVSSVLDAGESVDSVESVDVSGDSCPEETSVVCDWLASGVEVDVLDASTAPSVAGADSSWASVTSIGCEVVVVVVDSPPLNSVVSCDSAEVERLSSVTISLASAPEPSSVADDEASGRSVLAT